MEMSYESVLDDIFKSKEFDKPLFSEEAYFGLTNSFSQEMINYVNKLREELRNLLGGNWRDEAKTAIVIKNAFSSNKTTEGLSKIVDDMGKCIARNCNVEKCYIGLFNDINAHTLPLAFDSSILFSSMSEAVYQKNGNYYVNSKLIRTDKDIQSQLFKLDDIVINKDGYKFKEAKGKVFIINLGVPLIVDNDFESTTEEECSIIFHEIGHNFQQILRGSNQMLIDYYIRAHMMTFSNRKFYDLLGMLEHSIIHTQLKKILDSIDTSFKTRFSIIKTLLFCNVLINKDGTIVSRDNLGTTERANLERIIEAAKENNTLVRLSFITKFINVVAKTISKTIGLVFIPIKYAYDTALRNDLDKDYHELIKTQKSYEQFADTFAVAYGFGAYSGKFFIRIQELLNKAKDTGSYVSHLSILNYIPVLSKIDSFNELLRRRMELQIRGYDEDHVRIAQIHATLDHELTTNKDLSSKDKQEIIEHMEIVKQDYENFKKLEVDNFVDNPSLSKWLIGKLRSGDITTVANDSGLVEGVLNVIDEYEKNGIVKQSPIVQKIDEDISSSKSISKFDEMIKNSLNFITTRILSLKI